MKDKTLSLCFRGSVKDGYGPVVLDLKKRSEKALLFRFSDRFSVFDWGRMPETLNHKGTALNLFSACVFETLSSGSFWKAFSKTEEAFFLRKTFSEIKTFSASKKKLPPSVCFGEIGEHLQKNGVLHHYLGVVSEKNAFSKKVSPCSLDQLGSEGTSWMAVRYAHRTLPEQSTVFGTTAYDYFSCRTQVAPRVIPLEVVFRFEAPAGSSLVSRFEQKKGCFFLHPKGKDLKVFEGAQFSFPVIELFTKYESIDRPLGLTEALAISGLSASELEELLYETVWIASGLKYFFKKRQLRLCDGKLEFGMVPGGKLVLIDAIGPDELRLMKKNRVLSKEFLRKVYRTSAWFQELEEAKKKAKEKGVRDWKKLVAMAPPALDEKTRLLASQLYQVLAEVVVGKKLFSGAWDLEMLLKELETFEQDFQERHEKNEKHSESFFLKQMVSKKGDPIQRKQGDRVLVVGSGAREQALVWKIAQSPLVQTVVFAPGNDATLVAPESEVVFQRWEETDLSTQKGLRTLVWKAKEAGMDLVVIGPDDALADGLSDLCQKEGLAVFGPSQKAAQLESSKSFAKKLMQEVGVPTAEYEVLETPDQARERFAQLPWPSFPKETGWVLKADGLARGKGVVICRSQQEALRALEGLSKISNQFVLEKELMGEELSVFAFCDGAHAVLLDTVQDYKKLKDENRGPNTGGMGAWSPVPGYQEEGFLKKIKDQVFLPILGALEKQGVRYQGVLYAGLMVDPKSKRFWVLEFNARFGDPETQVLLPRMKEDLYVWLKTVARGELALMQRKPRMEDQTAVYIVGASAGYPEKAQKGQKVEAPVALVGSKQVPPYFYAAMKKTKKGWVSSGGRIFGALGLGKTLLEAREKAYLHLQKGTFSGMQFRSDIGKRFH